MTMYNHMVVHLAPDERLDRTLHALADPTRRDILRAVIATEHTVSALADRYPMSFAAVQKHVAVLERAELVVKHRRGREQHVGANLQPIRDVGVLFDELESVWRGRVDRMSEILQEEPKKTKERR